MRWPQFSLPRPSVAWIGALGGRMTWVYVSYTTILFLIFLVITFPHELLIRRAFEGLSHGPMAFDFSKAGFAGYNGYEVSGVRVQAPDSEGLPPVLETTRLWVRPTFGQLLRGNPYALSLRAELYGGTLNGDLQYKDGGVNGEVAWNDLNLGKYRTLTAQLDDGQISGKVSGDATFEARGANFAQGQAAGDLIIDGVALTQAKVQGWPIPDIHLTQAKTKFKIAAGRLDLQDFVATGDVNVQGSGQVLLKDPAADSVINLRVTLAATPQTPDAIKTALQLIPRPVGAKADAPVIITGTLSHPRVR